MDHMETDENEMLVEHIVSEYDPKLKLRQGQHDVLLHIANTNNDLIASFPTGYGKSLIFHLCGQILGHKLKVSCPVTLVIIPLNVIHKDQMDKLCSKNISNCSIGTTGEIKWMNANQEVAEGTVERVINGDYSIVITHPEGLLCSATGKKILNSDIFAKRVVSIVVDECHTVEEWGGKFREAFSNLAKLRTYFDCPVYGLSATIPVPLYKKIEESLEMVSPTRFKLNPDKSNIFLDVCFKDAKDEFTPLAELVIKPEMDDLKAKKMKYPVTLFYIPLDWAVTAQGYACEIFGEPQLKNSLYGILFSSQDKDVIDYIVEELKQPNPTMRLVICTAAVGMGFDSPTIERVIHGKPTYKMIDHVQQIGRAGRSGQPSTSIVHYNNNDIGSNLKEMEDVMRNYCRSDTCLRRVILDYFGFLESPVFGTCKCCYICADECKCGKCSMNK